MTTYDHISTYVAGVEKGSFDTDLPTQARQAIVVILRNALNILAQFGGTDRATLIRQVASLDALPAVAYDAEWPAYQIAQRAVDIINGCAA